VETPPRRLQEAGVTAREAEVLAAVSRGLPNPDIARRMFVSKRTVESHVAALLRKLEASDRATLVEIGLSAGAGTWSSLPPAVAAIRGLDGRFVGRLGELALAEELLTGERATTTLLWLLGEPGIGKTRLAVEIARRAHWDGTAVLFGGCDPELRVPYGPFLQALRGFVDHTPGAASQHRLGDRPQTLMPLVGPGPCRLPESDLEQYRLFEAMGSWLGAAGGPRRAMLVLDDLHWAATPTLRLLSHLARHPGPAGVLIVCTARNTAPDADALLAGLLEELDRRGLDNQRVELAGLDLAAVEQLVQSANVSGADAAPGDAAALHRETAGNPFFLQAMLEAVVEETGPDRLPRSVADTVHRRVERLPARVGQVLRTAAIVGLEFDLSVVAAACGIDDSVLVEAVEDAERAGLVVETAANRYRFTHALVRATLAEELSRTRRVRVHREVARAIETVHIGRLDEYAEALANHFTEAVPVGTATEAFGWTVRAAQRSDRVLAHPEAAAAYAQALDLHDRASLRHPPRHELMLARGEALRRAGKFGDARSALREAAVEAAALAAAETAARAAISFEETGFWLGVSGQDALELLQTAEAVLPPTATPTRALTAAAISRALQFTGQQTESLALAAEALRIAEQVGDPATTVRVLACSNMPYQYIADAHVAEARWAEVIDRARLVNDDLVLNQALSLSLWAAAQLGHLARFEELFDEFRTVTARLRLGGWGHYLDLFRSLRAFLGDDLDAAERFAHRAHDEWSALGVARDGLYGVAMFLIRRRQGRLGELLPAVRALAAVDPRSVWRPGRAALYAELDMLDEARADFEYLAAAEFTDLPTDGSRELCLGLLAEVCAKLGDAERAPDLLTKLTPCQGRLLVPVGSCACLGPTDRLLGLLAATAGHAAEAARWQRSAADLSARLNSPLWTPAHP
jgi:DNA-binding CsgD family transcriptional regulator/tetratricopeptide (TPR) repeat protein